MLIKKIYKAPKVQKVQLVIKNAVLGVCHSSPNMTPLGLGCLEPTVNACWGEKTP